jgi:hypothetical protein
MRAIPGISLLHRDGVTEPRHLPQPQPVTCFERACSRRRLKIRIQGCSVRTSYGPFEVQGRPPFPAPAPRDECSDDGPPAFPSPLWTLWGPHDFFGGARYAEAPTLWRCHRHDPRLVRCPSAVESHRYTFRPELRSGRYPTGFSQPAPRYAAGGHSHGIALGHVATGHFSWRISHSCYRHPG